MVDFCTNFHIIRCFFFFLLLSKLIMISLSFKIDYDAKADKSDIFLSSSTIKDLTIEQVIKSSILNNFDNSKNNKSAKNMSLKELWIFFQQFINENNFKWKNAIMLKEGKRSIRKFKDGSKKEIQNICINIISENKELKSNFISFYVDLKKSRETDLEEFDVYLKRIEFLKVNDLSTKFDDDVYLDEIIDNDGKQTNIENSWNKILKNLDFVFDNDDYDKTKDKIKIEEWFDFIRKLKDLYNIKNIKDNKTNFVFSFNDSNYLMSSINISNLKDYELNQNESNSTFVIEEDESWSIKKISSDFYTDILEQERNKLKNEFDEKKSILENKENEKTKNEKNLRKYEGTQKELEYEHGDIKTEINGIKENIAKREENEKKIKNQINEINNLLKKEKNEVKNLLLEIEKRKKLLLENKTSWEKLQSELKEQEKNGDEVREKIKKNNIEIINIKGSLEKLNNEINKIENKNKEIEKIIQNINQFREKYSNEFKFVYNLIYSSEKELTHFPKIETFNKLDEVEEFTFINKDEGTRALVNRFWHALRNVEQGYYKNPLFYLGVKDVEKIEIILDNELDNEIIEKYKLNEKQKSAITKAINTDSVFYLQGPPGTGKTQTICAIGEWITKNNMNLVMTSSTHEAINNFFDRFSDFNSKNPNIVAFKYRNMKADENEKKKADKEHDESSIYTKFKMRMKNFVCSNDVDDLINNLETKYNDFLELPKDQSQYVVNFFNKKVLPLPLVKTIFNNWENEEFKKQFRVEEEEEDLKSPISYLTEFTLQMENKINSSIDKDSNKDLLLKFQDLIDSHISAYIKLNKSIDGFEFNKNYLNFLNKFINKNKSNKGNKLESLISSINKQYNDKNINDIYESDFLNYIMKNRLINIIGVTATSENKIKLNGKEIFLYNEYPIDYMIIDEISKCSTPEILSKAILSKKVLFVGDYLQLPPSSNLSNDKIIKYLKENNWKELNDSEAIKKEIEELFKISFFKIQVNKIKENKFNKNKSYEFLNESHRFGKKIMDIVNIIYPNDEMLKLPKEYSKPEKINLKIKNNNYDSEVVLVNLLKPTEKFCESHEFNIKVTKDGFDQSGNKLFKMKIKITDGSYNQFSAYTISNIVKKLIEQNLHYLNKDRRIGIITLTRNQKNLIREYINKNNFFKQYKHLIKIDTIDNFQGREEDIVIVDFIRGKNKIENCKETNTKKRNISFLREKERINVALSRARQKLIMVGHFEYLKSLSAEGCSYFNNYYNELSSSNDSYLEWDDNCEMGGE